MDASTSTAANPNNSDYDVFISHRGPEVKKTFASHLYRRLISFGLKVFLDQSELERGGFIELQIDSAIKAASVQVAILSPLYAYSKWCLNELVSMLETGTTVIPVFYQVEPSKVRWNMVTEALQKLEEKKTDGPEGEMPRYDPGTIETWRKALSRVADISGFELKECNDDEGVLLDQVVERVLEKVKRSMKVADYPTGLDDKVKDFENFLLGKQHCAKPKVVGIVGLGGVGKTTLAKQLFNLKSLDYSRRCFLSDIRETASTPSLILSLQKKLLRSLIGSDLKLDNIDEGIGILEKHLKSHKALVILDDVDSETEVKRLFPVQTDLHADSLILITSRNTDVLRILGVEVSSIYTLTHLNTEHSRELFCLHAFKEQQPPEEFKSLVNQFLEACSGLPLSLTVFGAQLYRTNGTYWEEQLNKLQQTLPSPIHKRLKISYDALDKQEQEIFLDIACFFTRYNRDTAIRIWDGTDLNGSLGFQNLQSRCLVTVDSEHNIQIHDHLRHMGRDIAEDLRRCADVTPFPRRLWRWTNEVIKDLLQRSSVSVPTFGPSWIFKKIIFKFLIIFQERKVILIATFFKSGQGIIVRGIKMDLKDYNSYNAKFSCVPMISLQFLDTEEGILEDILPRVRFEELIWLRWKTCSHTSLPSCIPMKDLRVLQVSGSVLKTLWKEESKAPLELRELEIYAPLREIPKSIKQLEHLERIVVGKFSNIGRVNLIELPEEFCELKSLKALVLKECSRLKSLPHSFGKLARLEHIDLSFCRNLERLPVSFGSLTNLQQIDLSNCYDLKSLPNSFGSLENLQNIDLQGCHKLKRLPVSFGDLKKLKRINLSDCHGLSGLPESFGDLSKLEYIDFSRCHHLKSLPDSFGKLTKLQSINLSNCHDLETLPDCFDNLKNLQDIDLSRCHNLERLPNSLQNPNKSKILCLEGCSYLTM